MIDQLRSNDQYKELPVVLHTDSAQEHFINGALEKGVNKILTKPFSSWELRKVIAECLNQPWIDYCIYAEEDCFCTENDYPEECPLKKVSFQKDALQPRNLLHR